MSYEELSKLYYTQPEKYLSIYEERFNSGNAVKIDFEIKGKPAFYYLAPEVNSLTVDILQTDKRISLIKKELPGVAIEQFTKRCLVDEIVVTNKIEGVSSTRREISDILDELQSQSESRRKAQRFAGLVKKYYKLLSQEDVSLKTCEDIRAIYDEIVLNEVVSENPQNAPDGKIFRKESASVMSAAQKELHRGSYPESAIIAEMEKALSFLWREDVPKLYRVCIFHYLMEYIHPFYDGNGRTGRFIVSYLLSRELEPLLAYRLSYTIEENINAYYKAFEICDDVHSLGDTTPFLVMMLTMIKQSTAQLEQALKERMFRFKSFVSLIRKLPGGDDERTARAYGLLIQAGLFAEHGVTIDETAMHLDCSISTARKELKKIAAAGLLVTEKTGRPYHYKINVQALDDMLLEENKV